MNPVVKWVLPRSLAFDDLPIALVGSSPQDGPFVLRRYHGDGVKPKTTPFFLALLTNGPGALCACSCLPPFALREYFGVAGS